MTASEPWSSWRRGLPLIVLGFATMAVAQDADEAEPETVYPSEEIVIEATRFSVPDDNLIGTRLPLALRDTPASVTVVGAAQLERQGAMILGDALRNAAGAQVHTGFGVFDYFLLRGFDSLSNGLVLIDQAPEPEASFYPLYNVERVEVLRGPAAFLYGGNPLSGAVNLVPERARGHSARRLTTSVGSFGSVRLEADLARSRSASPWAARLNALWTGSDGYRDGRDSRSLAANPTVEWHGSDSWLRVSAEIVDHDYETDVGLPLVDDRLAVVPRTRSYQSPLDGSRQRLYRTRLEAEHRLGPEVLLRDRLYVTSFDWQTTGTLFNGVAPDSAGGLALSRIQQSLSDEQLFVGNQLEATGQHRLLGREHTWLFGMDLSRQSDRFSLDVGLLADIDLRSPVETAAGPLLSVPVQSGDARSWLAGVYFVDRIVLIPAAELFVGGRADAIDYRDTGADTERSYRQLSPMLGVVYRLTSRASAYASAGGGFAPPSSLVVGDRDVERSRQLEVGVKSDVADAASVAISVYELRKDGIAIPDASGVTREQGDQRSRGVELELRAQLGPGWFTAATYAYTDAELTRFREPGVVDRTVGGTPVFGIVDRSGKRPPFAPRHTATLWTTRDLAGFEVAAGCRWVGAQHIAADNAFRLDGAFTVDATLSRRIADGRLRLHLKNLTDTDYETRGFGATSVVPADPISVHAVFDWWL